MSLGIYSHVYSLQILMLVQPESVHSRDARSESVRIGFQSICYSDFGRSVFYNANNMSQVSTLTLCLKAATTTMPKCHNIIMHNSLCEIASSLLRPWYTFRAKLTKVVWNRNRVCKPFCGSFWCLRASSALLNHSLCGVVCPSAELTQLPWASSLVACFLRNYVMLFAQASPTLFPQEVY